MILKTLIGRLRSSQVFSFVNRFCRDYRPCALNHNPVVKNAVVRRKISLERER
jgi:hypothetical protein